MKNYFTLFGAMLLAGISLSATSCGDDNTQDAPPRQLDTPVITLASEKSDNPIVLEFSWDAVKNASAYGYQLKEAENGLVLASGETNTPSLQIAASGKIVLTSGTTYDFLVYAVSDNEQRFTSSEITIQSITTAASDFKLSISNITYRAADMMCWPADKTMKYYLTQIKTARYEEYPDDETFYNEYELGYYKQATFPWVPWYQFMEYYATKDDYGYHTGLLEPDTDYLLYAYGIKAVVEENTIALITPLVKLPFHTPVWEATADCSFTITEVPVADGALSFRITPTKDDVTYYFGVVTQEIITNRFNNDFDAYTRNVLYEQETLNNVEWATTDLLLTGEQTASFSAEQVAQLEAGEYYAFVCGVDRKGMQTTETTKTTFTVPAPITD